MDKFLFVDIDGVLATDKSWGTAGLGRRAYPDGYGFDDDCVRILEDVIRLEPDLKLVLSSSWRSHYKTPAEIQNAFSIRGFVFADHFVDKTDHMRFAEPHKGSVPRGCEIDDWLDKNVRPDEPFFQTMQASYDWRRDHPYCYAIIDDDGDMLYHQRNHFVQIEGMRGLQPAHVERIVRALSFPITY